MYLIGKILKLNRATTSEKLNCLIDKTMSLRNCRSLADRTVGFYETGQGLAHRKTKFSEHEQELGDLRRKVREIGQGQVDA